MKAAGEVILAFGIVLLAMHFKGYLRIGNIAGAAPPVMIVVGSLLMFA